MHTQPHLHGGMQNEQLRLLLAFKELVMEVHFERTIANCEQQQPFSICYQLSEASQKAIL